MTRDDGYEDRLEDLREQRYRALGTRSPCCSYPGCRETDPLTLTGVRLEILCREHLADRQSRRWTEDHHPPGRANDPATISLPANEHGAQTGYQELWPRQTLRNPDGSPLLRAAAWIRSWLDVLRTMTERAIGRIPAALERLDALLTEHLGPGWWERLGWDW